MFSGPRFSLFWNVTETLRPLVKALVLGGGALERGAGDGRVLLGLGAGAFLTPPFRGARGLAICMVLGACLRMGDLLSREACSPNNTFQLLS